MRLPRFLHLWLYELEAELDRWWRALRRALGQGKPRSVMPFTGWDNTGHAPAGETPEAVFGCRVFSTPLGGGPGERDRWWHNLRHTWHRWDTQEVPHARVTARLGDAEQTATADAEGYAWFRFAPPPAAAGSAGAASLRVADGGLDEADARSADRDAPVPETATVRGALRVLRPPADAPFGVISDLDDTVIHTGITNFLTAARLTFLGNARTRQPLAGVATLYRCLDGGRGVPFFYVSSSAWNLHDLLTGFLELQGLPPGPLMLQDLGLDAVKLVKEPGHTHKLDKARTLVDAHPRLPFVLFGDSGQADPHLYATLVRERPGRIAAIVIRDIDAGRPTGRTAEAQAHLDAAVAGGTPCFLVRDSAEAADHLVRLGLLPEASLAEVRDATATEASRPGYFGAIARGR